MTSYKFIPRTKLLIFFLGSLVTLIAQLGLNALLNHPIVSCNIPSIKSHSRLPTIYAITPTYSRHVQIAELTRLSHTFMLVAKLHWILVEDSDNSTDLVSKFVSRLKDEFAFLTITSLFAQTPTAFRKRSGEPDWKYPKGVWQRNKALEWIQSNSDGLDMSGILYFADDDNTYDLELFHEMRSTQKVAVWPVGLAGGLVVEKPIVIEGKVQSFNAIWARNRPYPIDMAGFAVNLGHFLKSGRASFSSNQPIGYLESHFLSQLVNGWEDLEPKADSCRKTLVWHTKTKSPHLVQEKKSSGISRDY